MGSDVVATSDEQVESTSHGHATLRADLFPEESAARARDSRRMRAHFSCLRPAADTMGDTDWSLYGWEFGYPKGN